MRAADQERVSQARAEAPSGPQSRQQGGGGVLQGSGRGLRGAGRFTEARPLRSLRARRRQQRRGWRRGLRSDHLRRLLRHLRRLFAGLGDAFGFGDLFGQRRRRGGPQRGADLRYDLEISFDESAQGVETTIQIPREETCDTCSGSGAAPGTSAETCSQCRGSGQLRYQQGFLTVARPCPNCRGTGKTISKPCTSCRGAGRIGRDRSLTVKIPAGIATGQRLRLYGEGEHGSAGGPPGDLYVVVHVQEHAFFHREGDDLYCEVSVPFHTMALGGEVRVPTLDGRDELNVPAGTQPGARFKLRGKGMPNVSGRGHGDLHVIAKVAVPKKLTKEQKQILEQLARTMPADKGDGDGTAPAEKPFFERVKDIFG
jgi:molecular chaperone DnaJ